MNETPHEPPHHTPADTERHHEGDPSPQPSIYVASLADYNNGRLHGTWLNAARDPDDIYADVATMLASSKEPDAEEFAIHDYDQFGHCRIGEYDRIEHVAALARGIAEHGYAYAAWRHTRDDDSDPDDAFHEAYLGHYASITDYAEQFADDLGYTRELEKLPEFVQKYTHIDYAAIARDLEASGDIASIDDPEGGVWLFNGDI